MSSGIVISLPVASDDNLPSLLKVGFDKKIVV
jgi:hypothetical protein